MENNIQDIINKFCTFYSANKNNKKLDGLTNFLLREALSAQGYNNYKNQEDSGELFLLNKFLKEQNPHYASM